MKAKTGFKSTGHGADTRLVKKKVGLSDINEHLRLRLAR